MNAGKKIAGYDCIIDDAEIWFFAMGRNYLCQYRMNDQTKRLYPIGNKDILFSDKQLYHIVLKIDNWILLGPRVADTILLFNTENSRIQTISIPESRKVNSEFFTPDEAKFWRGFTYKKYFFLLGFAYPGIIRIDSESLEVDLIDDWVKNVEKMISDNYIGFLADGYIVDRQRVLLPLYCIPALLELDLETLDSNILQVGGVAYNGIYGLAGTRENMWLTGWGNDDNKITQICGNEVKQYPVDGIRGEKHLFYSPIVCSEGIFIIPVQYEESVFYFDKEEEKFQIWKMYKGTSFIARESGYSFMEPHYLDGSLLLVNGQTYEWYIENLESGKNYSFNIDIQDEKIELEYWNMMINEMAEANRIVTEGDMSIELFLKALTST